MSDAANRATDHGIIIPLFTTAFPSKEAGFSNKKYNRLYFLNFSYIRLEYSKFRYSVANEF